MLDKESMTIPILCAEFRETIDKILDSPFRYYDSIRKQLSNDMILVADAFIDDDADELWKHIRFLEIDRYLLFDLAIKYKKFSIVQILLQKYNYKYQSPQLIERLRAVIATGDYTILSLFLEKIDVLHVSDQYRREILCECSGHYDMMIAEKLITKFKFDDIIDYYIMTWVPNNEKLAYNCMFISFLLENGCVPTAKQIIPFIHEEQLVNWITAIDVFKSYGYDVKEKTLLETTVLNLASNRPVCEILNEKHESIHLQDIDGNKYPCIIPKNMYLVAKVVFCQCAHTNIDYDYVKTKVSDYQYEFYRDGEWIECKMEIGYDGILYEKPCDSGIKIAYHVLSVIDGNGKQKTFYFRATNGQAYAFDYQD